MNDEQPRLELHCHLAADGADPLLRKIILVRGSQPVRHATIRGIRGAKTINAFCIGLLRAKYRSLDISLGPKWGQIAQEAPRNTWAATLVENLGENKIPAWWEKSVQPELQNLADKNSLVPLPFRFSETHGKFNVSFEPDSKNGDGFWSIGRLRFFLGGSEITGNRLRSLASEWERKEASWESVPLPMLTIPAATPTANLELLIRSHGSGRFLSISGEPSLLPVIEGEALQLRIHSEQSVYFCLAWINECGKPFPMYPWDWKKTEQKTAWQEPAIFEKRTDVIVPDGVDASGKVLTIENKGGLQTLVLMVNQDVPPNRDIIAQLPDLLRIKDVPGSILHSNEIRRSEFTRNIKRQPTLRVRGPVIIEDPIRVLHTKVSNKLVGCFDYVTMLSFFTKRSDT